MLQTTKAKKNIRKELRERCIKRCKGVKLCGNCKRYQRFFKRYGEPLDPVDCLEDVAIDMILEQRRER